MTPRNVQDTLLCDTPQFLENTDAITDKDGIASWNTLTLRHGAATDYMIIVKLLKIGSALKSELTPDDHILDPLKASVKLVPPSAVIDVHHWKFDSETFELSMNARVKWQQPQSALQTVFSAVSKVGQVANSSGLIDFAKAGVEALPKVNPMNLNPMCVFMALDLEDVVNFNIAQVPSFVIWNANISHHETKFSPSAGSTTSEGTGDVFIKGRLNSYTFGWYLAVSCLGVVQPISPFREDHAPWPMTEIPRTVFPNIPQHTDAQGRTTDGTLMNLKPRASSLTATVKSGTVQLEGTAQQYYVFSETDEVIVDLKLEWNAAATAKYQKQNVVEQTVFCQLYEAPPDTGLLSMAAELAVRSGAKELTNGTVRVPMAVDASTKLLTGTTTVHGHFTTSGSPGFYLAMCTCETQIVMSAFSVQSAVSAEKSSFLVAPQPWETSSSSSSTTTSSSSSTASHEKLGVPWLQTPTLRIISKDGLPLSGKHVAIFSYGLTAMKYQASTSDPEGFISFSSIMCTSTGLGSYTGATNYSSSSSSSGGGVPPKQHTFGFFVDNILIGNHTIILEDNPGMSPSAFCNARMVWWDPQQSVNTSETLAAGIPLKVNILVTDGYDRPLPRSIVRVRVPQPFILLCTITGGSSSSADPRAWRSVCPPTGNTQDLVADNQGWVRLDRQPSNTGFAIGGVVEESRTVDFSFECSQVAGATKNNTQAESTAAASLITSKSQMRFKVESLVQAVEIDLMGGNRTSISDFSTAIDMYLRMSPAFWRIIRRGAPVPFAAIYPRMQYFTKPATATELYPGDEPIFIVTDGNPVESDPRQYSTLKLEVELFFSRNVYGTFAAAISFDGSARFLPSTIQLFNNIRFARELRIVQPLQFSPVWSQLAVTGVPAAQQPIIQVIDGRSPTKRFVQLAQVIAFIRLWDITKNEKIRDVNPFINADDLEYGALVDTTVEDGRPISFPVFSKLNGRAYFRKLTLAGVLPGAAFKVVYRVGIDGPCPLTALPFAQDTESGVVEIEQDTIFFGGTPAPIVVATPQPYAVADVPVPVLAAQPLPVPMLLIPRCDKAKVFNYDSARAALAQRTLGSLLNDTDLGRHWFFEKSAYTTTSSSSGSMSFSSVSSNFEMTFGPTTASGSYQVYTLYPGGRTPETPVLVVASANNVQIDIQPPRNVSIGSPFSATVLVTAQGGIPMPGIGVMVTMKPAFQCDGSVSFFTNVACGSVSGQVIAVTDLEGKATVTLIAESALEGHYYLDFQLVTTGADSLAALAKRSFNKLAEASGGVINASALDTFNREVSDLLTEAVSQNVAGGSSVASGISNSLIAPLLAMLQSGQSSLPFKIWNPVAKIEVVQPIEWGALRPPMPVPSSSSSSKVPAARLLNRNGVPVADVIVAVTAVPSASVSVRLDGATARTDSSGIATFPNLRITQSSGSGPVRLSFTSLGFASTTPQTVAVAEQKEASQLKTQKSGQEGSTSTSLVVLSNVTILPPPTTQEMSLSERMQLVAFISIAALIPFLIANVRRTHVFWVGAAAATALGVFIFEVISLGHVDADWSTYGWIRIAYNIFYSVLLGLLTLSMLYLLFLVIRRGREAYESQTSGRLRRAYKYTKWLINVRRNSGETVETHRQKKNKEIRDSFLYRTQEKISCILPFQVIKQVRIDEMEQMPPIEIPADIEPAELPLKYFIILGVGIVITCSLFLVSFWAANIIGAKLEDAISYLPRGEDTLRISTSQLSGGEFNVGVTVSAEEGSQKTQEALVSLLRVVAKNVPQLVFLNKWANFIDSIDIMHIVDTTRDILEYIQWGLPLGHGVAQTLAFICLVVTLIMLGLNTKRILIELRRGQRKEVRKAEFRKADEYIGSQAMLFAVQHQLVFWSVFLFIIVLLVLIFTRMFWPIVTPILIASVIPVVQTVSIELAAIKFIRSFRDTVKNPFLYSIYSVVANVLGIFGAFISLILRFVLGIVFMLVIFARPDIGLFPACLSSFDPAFESYFCAMSLDNRYNHPLFITAVAILSVEARIAKMARREKRLEEKAQKSPMDTNKNGNLQVDEDEQDEEEDEDELAQLQVKEFGRIMSAADENLQHRVIPRVLARLCSVPTVATLIQLHTQVIIDRWRKKQGISVERVDDKTSPGFCPEKENGESNKLDVEMLAVAAPGGAVTYSVVGASSPTHTYPLASELYEEMQKSKRYVRAARRFQLLLLLHFNPSLRRFRKRALAAERERAEQNASANKADELGEHRQPNPYAASAYFTTAVNNNNNNRGGGGGGVYSPTTASPPTFASPPTNPFGDSDVQTELERLRERNRVQRVPPSPSTMTKAAVGSSSSRGATTAVVPVAVDDDYDDDDASLLSSTRKQPGSIDFTTL